VQGGAWVKDYWEDIRERREKTVFNSKARLGWERNEEE